MRFEEAIFMLETLKTLKQKRFRSTSVPQNYAPSKFFFYFIHFFSILRVKSSPYPVRDSKPIIKTLKAFIFKVFSVFFPIVALTFFTLISSI